MKDLCNMSHLYNYTGEICKTLTINCHILLYDKLENRFVNPLQRSGMKIDRVTPPRPIGRLKSMNYCCYEVRERVNQLSII